MINIKEAYNKFVIKLQESFLTRGSKKRIQLMLHYIDIRPSDVLLDVGGNTYGRTYRPHIKFVEGGVENIPLPSEHFDRIVASLFL